MKIITLTPNQVDATSFYRAWGVFPDIMKRSDIAFTDYYDAQMMLGEGKRGFTWANALQYDAAFFQRAFGNVIEIAKFMKDCGLKIIYELDDNLWEIPNSFDIKRFYDKDKLSTMVYMLKISDLVIVSTQALADYISTAFDVKCEVVNNAIDLNKYPIQPYNEDGALIWRGSSTHRSDLRQYREVMEGIQETLQVWGYDIVNNEPKLKLNKFTFVKPLDPIYYFANLRAEKPRGIVTPLVEDVFNACKSNIAYLEATMAGAVCYSNQWGEFKNKGLSLSEVNNKYHKEAHEAATIDVKENYSLKQANDKRIDLIKSL